MGEQLRSTMDDDGLDRQLREAVPYIDDAGFTAGVIAKLPARQSATYSVRSFILIGVTMIASLLAYILSDGGRFITVEVMRLSTLPLLWLSALAFGGGMLVMAGGLYAALAKAGNIRT